MVRVRVPGGVLPTDQARGLARLAPARRADWVHLTTRQNIELHWVEDREVAERARRPRPARAVDPLGVRPHAAQRDVLGGRRRRPRRAVRLLPRRPGRERRDRRPLRGAQLRRCRAGSTSPSAARPAAGRTPWSTTRLRVGRAGRGAGLRAVGRRQPRQGARWRCCWPTFVPRARRPGRGRGARRGLRRPRRPRRPGQGPHEVRGRARWAPPPSAPRGTRRSPPRAPPTAARPAAGRGAAPSADRVEVLAQVPPGGWSAGVRPAAHRRAWRCSPSTCRSATPTAPSWSCCADLADRHADGHLTLGRDQDVVLRNVALGGDRRRSATPSPSAACSCRGEGPPPRSGPAPARRSAPSGITTAPDAGTRARSTAPACAATPRCGCTCQRLPELVRPAPGRRHRPGRLEGAASAARPATATSSTSAPTSTGTSRCVGEVVGRVAAEDVPAAVDAVVGAWEALRHAGEPLGRHRRPRRPRRHRRPRRRRPRRPLGDRPRARPGRRPRRLTPPIPTQEDPQCPSPSPKPSTSRARLRPRQGRRASPSLPRYLLQLGPRRRLRRRGRRPAGQRERPAARGRLAVDEARAGRRVRHRPDPGRLRRRRAVHRQRDGDGCRAWSPAGSAAVEAAAVLVASLVGNFVGSVGFAAARPRRRDASPARAPTSSAEAVAAKDALTGPAAAVAGDPLQPAGVPRPLDGVPHPQSDGAKLAVLWWALLAFIASGFEHSVANMTTLQPGRLRGQRDVGRSSARNLAWTVPGNMIGGGLLVGLGLRLDRDAGQGRRLRSSTSGPAALATAELPAHRHPTELVGVGGGQAAGGSRGGAPPPAPARSRRAGSAASPRRPPPRGGRRGRVPTPGGAARPWPPPRRAEPPARRRRPRSRTDSSIVRRTDGERAIPGARRRRWPTTSSPPARWASRTSACTMAPRRARPGSTGCSIPARRALAAHTGTDAHRRPPAPFSAASTGPARPASSAISTKPSTAGRAGEGHGVDPVLDHRLRPGGSAGSRSVGQLPAVDRDVDDVGAGGRPSASAR